ncbi:hypothetical protein NDU88_007336 [Pleurodeles waltl]|uniref:Uncharacterized protein n=1 Tax=Pleurodeles waltl TaxID=8319 RepID=A0AAV7VSI7_PLEWA|nr:hypothetical protein NDU88_007336 [Pleurodeles waltl]
MGPWSDPTADPASGGEQALTPYCLQLLRSWDRHPGSPPEEPARPRTARSMRLQAPPTEDPREAPECSGRPSPVKERPGKLQPTAAKKNSALPQGD